MEKTLTNGNYEFKIRWKGNRWMFNNKNQPNAKNFTITNANKKNGTHKLRVKPQRAYANYTRGYYLNMRKKNPGPRVKNRMNSLIDYMNKHHLNVTDRLYRGIPKEFTSSNLDLDNVVNRTNYAAKLLNKKKLNSNSFISFSTSKNMVNYGFKHGAGGITVMLEPGMYPAIRNGKNGFMSQRPSEREVLLAPGRLTLVSNSPNKNGSWHVTYTRAARRTPP
jgi:hypothetical protein